VARLKWLLLLFSVAGLLVGASSVNQTAPSWCDWALTVLGSANWSNWALVIVAIGGTWIAIRTLKNIEQQTRAAITSANAAKESADTAAKALNHTREASESELRAYVLISSATILNAESRTGRIAQVTIRNFGQTPAHDVRYWFGTRVDEYPPDLSEFQRPLSSQPMSVEVLAPTRTAILEVPIEGQEPPLEAELLNGHGAIFVFGEVTYRDPFNRNRDSPVRLTSFRLISRGESIRLGRLSPDVEGNEAN
jgi:hypothetical protein